MIEGPKAEVVPSMDALVEVPDPVNLKRTVFLTSPGFKVIEDPMEVLQVASLKRFNVYPPKPVVLMAIFTVLALVTFQLPPSVSSTESS